MLPDQGRILLGASLTTVLGSQLTKTTSKLLTGTLLGTYSNDSNNANMDKRQML